MENVEKSIARIMADKVYTSSEFKRERDTFNSLCKDLERAEVRKWLQQILEILMAERAKEQKNTEFGKLDTLVKEWTLLDNTVTELNSWVAKDKSAEGENQFSLEKMESTLGELKN